MYDVMKNDNRRITTFETFYAQTMKADEISHKYVTTRSKWLDGVKESKTIEKVIDKIPADELESADDLEKNNQIGSFIDAATILDVYGDDYQDVLDVLGDNGILVYSWNDSVTIWQKKEGGLVRIK